MHALERSGRGREERSVGVDTHDRIGVLPTIMVFDTEAAGTASRQDFVASVQGYGGGGGLVTPPYTIKRGENTTKSV